MTIAPMMVLPLRSYLSKKVDITLSALYCKDNIFIRWHKIRIGLFIRYHRINIIVYNRQKIYFHQSNPSQNSSLTTVFLKKRTDGNDGHVGDKAFLGCKKIKSIYCQGTSPARRYNSFEPGWITPFEQIVTQEGTLYVPIGSTNKYRQTEWKEFKNIVEYDFSKLTGIDKVTTDSDNQGENSEVARYSINGQRLNAPTQGLNIVKYSDGTTKKVMVP